MPHRAAGYRVSSSAPDQDETLISYLRRVTTHLPPDEVFDYLADFVNVDGWDPRAHQVRRLSGGPGVGARHVCEVSFAGRTVPMTYTTTALSRPSRIEWVGTSELVRASDVIHVLAEDGGTRVDYVASFEFARAPWLLERVLDLPLRRLLDDATRGLGDVLPPALRAA